MGVFVFPFILLSYLPHFVLDIVPVSLGDHPKLLQQGRVNTEQDLPCDIRLEESSAVSLHPNIVEPASHMLCRPQLHRCMMVVVVPPLFPGGVVPLLGGRVSQQVRAGARWLVEMLKLQWDDSNMAWLCIRSN